MSDVHVEDAYGRLHALCHRLSCSLEIERRGSGLELQVIGPGKDARISSRFSAGRENHAAAALLRKLRTTA